MATPRVQFPNLGAAVVTEGGLLTQEWRQFFQNLWARTGSAVGGLEIKTGTILAYAAAEVPEGYLLCDGSEVSRTLYPNLYKLLLETYGIASASTLFKLPDGRDKALLGVSAGKALGTFGGRDYVTLTEAELPSHTHGVLDDGHTHGVTESPHTHSVTDPGHSHGVTDPGHLHTSLVAGADAGAGAAVGTAAGNTGSATTGVTVNSATTGITLGSASTAATIDSAQAGIELEATGDEEPFSIQNPYLAINWIIKT